MKPDFVETLVAMKRVVAEIIRPQVQDSYALKQLDHIEIALGDLACSAPSWFAWRRESFDTLTTILADLEAFALSDGGMAFGPVLIDLQEALAPARAPLPDYPTMDDIDPPVAAMRSALSKAIPILNRGAVENGRLAEINDRVRAYLRKSAEHG